MAQTQITIILPVFNGERFLRQAIDSVLAQSYPHFELWVCNDGSTDSSMEIVNSYHDPRILRIDNPQNMGLVATLNRAFALVKTPFIARMDDDDIWEPHKLELQMQLLEHRPDVGICGTSIRKFGDINSICLFPQESDALKVGLLFYCMMSHPSVVYRRSFLVESGLSYQANFYPAEDYKMWIDALRHTHIHNLQQPLVNYRQHATQICRTQSDDQKQLEQRLQTEQLHLIYPDCSQEELDFHLNHFVPLSFSSDEEVRRASHWVDTICKANLTTQYVNPKVLRQELQRYFQNAVRTYYRSQPKNIFGHIFSGRWCRLNLRRNLSLLRP